MKRFLLSASIVLNSGLINAANVCPSTLRCDVISSCIRDIDVCIGNAFLYHKTENVLCVALDGKTVEYQREEAPLQYENGAMECQAKRVEWQQRYKFCNK